MGPEKILILSVLFATVSASKRQLLNTDSGNVGGVHNTTNNVGLFVGAADAIKAVPIGQGPLVSVGDVKVGTGRQKRQLINTDSGNVGGVHETTNNVGPLVGLSDAIKAVPIGKSPLVSVGDVQVGKQKRQLLNTDSGNVGGVHNTTNNVGLFVGAADAIKAVPIGQGPLVSVGDVKVGTGREKRQLINTDSGNVGGVHETTNNVGPLVGLSDAIKAVPIGKSPLISVGEVSGRQKRGIFCFLGVGCDKEGIVVNNDIGHTGGSYSTVNAVAT